MEKKQLREKVFEIYRKIYKTDEKPGTLDLACMLNVLANAIMCSYNAEEELGKEVCDAIKRCTKVLRNSTKVDVTKFQREIGYYEED